MPRTYHLKIKVARDAGKTFESSRKVEAHKIERCADDEIGNLGDSLGTDESQPMVCFRLLKFSVSQLLKERQDLKLSLTFFSRVSKMSRL